MTNSRLSTAVVLTAVLVLTLGSGAYAESASGSQKQKAAAADASSTSTKSAEKKASAQNDHKVIVYYFHGDMRCTNCTNFEKYTDELMKTTFAEAVKNGSLEWRIVNTDKRGNEHYMKDYQLYTKSIVMVDTKGGKQTKFKNLAGIWQTIGSKSKFQNYVKTEIQSYLGGK